MRFSRAARDQLAELRRHYRRKNRPEAVQNLSEAVRQAARRITEGKSQAAPGTYPEIAQAGHAWIHAGRYWFVHTSTRPHIILAVFYDESDIPGRFER